MAWLANLLGRGVSREVEEEIVQAPPKIERPPLMLLLSDASGMAALRMMTFENAEEAAGYIEFWYPKRSTGTVFAVWALPGEPDPRWMAAPEHRGEAVILVRDERRNDVVYPFSFVDLDKAWTFLRQEMQKDLDLGRVSIYWAVPIDIEVDALGKVHMSPDAPPPASRPDFALAAATIDPPVVAEAAAVAERADSDEFGEIPVSRTTIVYHDEPVAQEDAVATAEALFEDDGDDFPEPPHEELEPVVASLEPEPVEALPELIAEKFGTPFHEVEFASPAGEAPEEAEAAKDIEPENAAQSDLVTESEGVTRNGSAPQPAAPEGEGDAMKSHDSKRNGRSQAVPPGKSANNHPTANGDRRTPSDRYEVADDLAKLLEGRRFDRKEGPFKGFNSPRGRF
jgi:hypothetical protein